jgi:signal transduction histidine kinase
MVSEFRYNFKKIFDMFYRISSKSQGSVGLYIVKDTVAKLQGNSGPLKINKGTTFYITLKKKFICRTKIKVSKGDAY